MKISIKFTQLDSTPALVAYIETKLKPLEKFIKDVNSRYAAEVHIEVARATKHHHKGDVYRVTANFDMPGLSLRAQEYASDARTGITAAARTLKNAMEKKKELKVSKSHARGYHA